MGGKSKINPIVQRRPRAVLAFLILVALACNLPLIRSAPDPTEDPRGNETPELPQTSSQASSSPGPSPTPTPFTCEQPDLSQITFGPAPPPGTSARATPEPGEPPVLPSLQFLEMPFPYDGGNENFGGTDAQFRNAVQLRYNGGRINSFFDHLLPVYPAPDGGESKEAPIGGNILIYDGTLTNQANYSGHPGYDFSTFAPRQPTTPLFAPADGLIEFVDVAYGGSYTVRLIHRVEGVGDFMTLYLHLHPDEHFEAMKAGIGKPIAAGTRIGTMGNTGYSTGHHLHFEVRFDSNRDGLFAGSEVIDPFGFIPGPEYSQDPWGLRLSITDESGQAVSDERVSPYLWVHPLGSAGEVGADGAGKMVMESEDDDGQPASVCAPPGSLPENGTLFWSFSPDPLPLSDLIADGDLVGAGEGVVVSAVDEEGEPIEEFDPPLVLEIPFSEGDIANLDRDSLGIYWLPAGAERWIELLAHIDWLRQIVVFEIDLPGRGALMGLPTRDLFPPRSLVQIQGEQSGEGGFYEQVTISLESEDPSGVEKIEYSLDNGETWLEYEGPFTVDPLGIPQPYGDDQEPTEIFGGVPGRFAVLVSATDSEGNVEDPPSYHWFQIDPRENPETTVIALMDSHCRFGPGTIYDSRYILFEHEIAPLDGRNPDMSWWWIDRLDGGGHCWIADAVVETSGDVASLPIIAPPPTPTPMVSLPAAPTRLLAEVSCDSSEGNIVWLSWIDNSDNESGFRIYLNGQSVGTVGPDVPEFIDYNVPEGPLFYEVRAYNLAGSSAPASVQQTGCYTVE